MQKHISRRTFLAQAAAVSGASLLAASGAAPVKGAARGKGPRPYRPTRAEIAQSFAQQSEYDALNRLPVYQATLTPHWFADNTAFWYRTNFDQGKHRFMRVDAAQGVRAAAFDHAKLAAGLSKAAGEAYTADRLPLTAFEYAPDGRAITFDAGGKFWTCDLHTSVCTPMAKPAETPAPKQEAPKEDRTEGASPDGVRTVFVKDHNLWLREAKTGRETALTQGGTEKHPFVQPEWSPNSRTLAAYQSVPAEILPVYLIESSPKDGGTRGILHQHEYAQPDDPLPLYTLWTFDAAAGTGVKAEMETLNFGSTPNLHWREDGQTFLFEHRDRGHRFFQILEITATTGKARVIVDDRTKPFINTSNIYTHYTPNAAGVIYATEVDGWRHLYYYDAVGTNPPVLLTPGDWVVRGVDRVDDDARQLWFQGSGRNPGEDPYLIHHYRVSYDGTGFVALTGGNGTHSVQYSPNRAYLIDTYSRADLPPVHTLRKAADGSLVCALETTDISALTAAGWKAPEVFSAKGRDGVTNIWGIVFRPAGFDPAKKYPIIENIYAGPQDSFVRKTFAVRDSMQSLANLGFVVVQCDGMGTRNRSKAFHNVCWHNLKDAGFPDRILWMKAVAAKYPCCDIERVGIYGTSAGGQNSTGALLFHPDFYKVGVSSCGCHDNRIDKQWWNEQWMGYPVGPWYAESSNIDSAAKLRGKLLLIVGEMDTNVPPESTIRLTDALMKAGKDFELIVITGSDHTGGGPYGERRRRDFFVRHLLGVEPPDRNVPVPPPAPVILPVRPISDESLASGDGGADTTVEFRNGTRSPVALSWLPGDGTRKPYGEVGPGESREMHTYSGHWWLVTTASGKPLAVFVGEDHPGIANIPAKPEE